MNAERDELATIIGEQFEHPSGPGCPSCADVNRAADAVLAAGYRKAEFSEYVAECENMEEDDQELFWTLDEAKNTSDECCTIKERHVTAWTTIQEPQP